MKKILRFVARPSLELNVEFKHLILIFLLILQVPLSGNCQIDLTRYYNPRFPILVLDDHMKVDFAWNMKGNQQALINEGINSLDEDNVNVALLNLNRAIKLDPKIWVSHYYRGICYKKLGDYDSAEYDFDAALALNSEQAEIYIEQAENHIAKKNLKKASNVLEAAIEKNPMLPQSYYNQAGIAIMEGNLTKAKKLYKKTNEVGPKYPDAYLMQGLLTTFKNNTAEGLLLIGKALKADSSYSTGYFWRGMLLLLDNKVEECLKDWNKLIQYNPSNIQYVAMRGYLHIELNQYDKAFIDLKNALKEQEIDENRFGAKQNILDKQIDLQAAAKYLIANGYGLDETAFAFLKKGFCLLLKGDSKGAMESLTIAENLQPSATVYYLKAISFEHLSMHQEALEYYSRALKRDNDIFDAHKKRSIYRFELKDWAGAQEDINHMLRLSPGSPVAYRLSGLIKAHKQDYAEAVKDLSQYMKSDSTDAEIIETRAVCYTMLGDRDKAHQDITTLLVKDSLSWPIRNKMVEHYLILKDTAQALATIKEFLISKSGYFAAYKKMAWIYIQQKDYNQAQLMIDKVKSIIDQLYHEWDYSDLYLWEGQISYHAHDFKEAIPKFNKSFKLDEKNVEAFYWRARAYQAMGETKKALDSFKKLSEMNYKDSKAFYEALALK